MQGLSSCLCILYIQNLFLALADDVEDQLPGTLQSLFLQRSRDVGPHRTLFQLEQHGDLLDRESIGQESGNLCLLW